MSDSWREDAEDGSFGELLLRIAGTAEPGSTLEPGTRFAGHYEIVQSIGSGGVGIVFLATDVRLDRKVALKLLKSRQSKKLLSAYDERPPRWHDCSTPM